MSTSKHEDFQPEFAIAAAMILLCALSILVPQIVLRPTANSVLGFAVFAPLSGGLAVFGLTMLVLHRVNLVLPRWSSHQIVGKYLGTRVGLVLGTAHLLGYAMLILLGVELTMLAVGVIVPVGSLKAPVSALLVVFLALPSLARRPRMATILLYLVALLATLTVVATVVVALVAEARDTGLFADSGVGKYIVGGSAPRVVGPPETVTRPLFEAFLGSCLPAAAALFIGERILVRPNYRRVATKRSMRFFLIPWLVIGVTLYLVAQLGDPYVIDTIPILTLQAGLLPRALVLVAAGIIAALGVALVLSAYWQLPRLLRELAFDGMLPRKLGVQDVVGARRFVVLIVAVTCGFGTYFINSARFVAMIFIFVAFLMGLLMCVAMVMRSNGILRNSTDAQERLDARRQRLVFAVYSVLLVALNLSFFTVSVEWVLWAVGLAAGPALFLGFYRLGQGRVSRILSVDDFLAGRARPTKVHGLILVNSLNEATLRAVDWANSMRLASLQALCVDIEPSRTRQLREDWDAAKIPLNLTILGTPAGALRGPIVEFVRRFHRTHPNEPITVIVPRVVGSNDVAQFIARFTSPRIVSELRREPGVMLLEVPYVLDTSTHDGHISRVSLVHTDSAAAR